MLWFRMAILTKNMPYGQLIWKPGRVGKLLVKKSPDWNYIKYINKIWFLYIFYFIGISKNYTFNIVVNLIKCCNNIILVLSNSMPHMQMETLFLPKIDNFYSYFRLPSPYLIIRTIILLFWFININI